MATINNYGLQGVNGSLRYGKGGNVLKSDAGEFYVLGSNGTDFANISGKAPSLPDHLVTKNYVDSVAQGLDIKEPVRAATTSVDGDLNLALGGLLTIDGVALASDDRVLVKNQALPKENGIYLAKSGTWLRALDADTSLDVRAGLFTFVTEGSLADTGWVLATDNPITLGTTGLSFIQFSSAGVVLAGAGLVKTGNTLDVQVSGTTTAIVSNKVVVKSSGTAGQVMLSNAGTAEAEWGNLDLANGSAITGVLPTTNGGTNLSTIGTANQFLSVNAGADGLEYKGFTTSDGVTVTYTAGGINIAPNKELGALQANIGTGILVRTGTATYADRTLEGTTDRVTITAGSGVSANPSVDIASTYIGQNSITTLGTIATGTWSADTIVVGKGGTGVNSLTLNGVVFGNGTSPVGSTAQGAIGSVLVSGASNVPEFGLVDVGDNTNAVKGVLNIVNGGLGMTTVAAGDLVYGSGAVEYSRLSIGSTGNVLSVVGGLPAWGTISIDSDATVGTAVLRVKNGGTGLATIEAHAVMIGAGTSNVALVSAAEQFKVLTAQGVSSDPSYGYVSALRGTNGLVTVNSTSVTNAVNNVSITNGATGDSPKITVTGSDTNINLVLEAKGTGLIVGPVNYDMSTGPDESFTSKGYVDNLVTVKGASNHVSAIVFAIDSTMGEVSGQTIPQGARVTQVKVNVTTLFDAPISFGITGSTARFASEAEIDEAGGISVIELLDGAMASDTTVGIFSSGSPTAGAGTVEITFKLKVAP